jgi:hypothetical protein
MEAVNLLIKIAVHNAYVFDLIEFGGPDRDRTDELFHAISKDEWERTDQQRH